MRLSSAHSITHRRPLSGIAGLSRAAPGQRADAKAAYGWTAGPFEVPADIKARWEQMGERGAAARAEWQARLDALSGARKA